jgi:proteasome lid subunit RPN8/RPN11
MDSEKSMCISCQLHTFAPLVILVFSPHFLVSGKFVCDLQLVYWRYNSLMDIGSEVVLAIEECCAAAFPQEACGIVTSGGVLRQMTNASATPETNYEFDIHEQLKLYAWLDQKGDEIALIWHSHTSGTAQPSVVDRLYATEPCLYLIVRAFSDGNCLLQWWNPIDKGVVDAPFDE